MEGGSSRHAVVNGRSRLEAPASDPHRLANLLLLTLLPRQTMWGSAMHGCVERHSPNEGGGKSPDWVARR